MSAERRIYLDHNATAPLRPEAKEAFLYALDRCGNASCPHFEGGKARGLLDRARQAVADLCQSQSQDIIFTSGATEANALALSPFLKLRRSDPRSFTRLLVLASEHPSVLFGHDFAHDAVTHLPVQPNGVIDQTQFAAILKEWNDQSNAPLVSIQAANSETGVMQDIPALAAMVHAVGGLLHVDAVQAAGRVPLDQCCAGADLLSLSAHKLGGPQGVGALVMLSGAVHFEKPLIRGGGQEQGRRSGTENVAAIHAFGAACEAARHALPTENLRLTQERDRLIDTLQRIDPQMVVFGLDAPRLPNTVYFAPSFVEAQTALMRFDLAGVALSSGSACSSGKVKESHVLQAMGVEPSLRKRAVRLSIGWSTTSEELDHFCSLYEQDYQNQSGVRAA